jgi:hypothetical protein
LLCIFPLYKSNNPMERIQYIYIYIQYIIWYNPIIDIQWYSHLASSGSRISDSSRGWKSQPAPCWNQHGYHPHVADCGAIKMNFGKTDGHVCKEASRKQTLAMEKIIWNRTMYPLVN